MTEHNGGPNRPALDGSGSDNQMWDEQPANPYDPKGDKLGYVTKPIAQPQSNVTEPLAHVFERYGNHRTGDGKETSNATN